MTTWVLMAWLCTIAGPSGSCRPLPDESFATRGECLRAARQAREESPHVFARCQMREPAE